MLAESAAKVSLFTACLPWSNPRWKGDLWLLGHPPYAISMLKFGKMYSHLAYSVVLCPSQAMHWQCVHILLHFLGPFWSDFPEQSNHILPDVVIILHPLYPQIPTSFVTSFVMVLFSWPLCELLYLFVKLFQSFW